MTDESAALLRSVLEQILDEVRDLNNRVSPMVRVISHLLEETCDKK